MMNRSLRACASATLLCFAGATVAQARSGCATEGEISAIQVSAVQQELTDAALACGQHETDLFNRFQTIFNRELRRSDAQMLSMFKRVYGSSRGNAEYQFL